MTSRLASCPVATVLAFSLLLSLPAQADIYKCVDGSGSITYTNAKSSAKGCTVLSRDMPSQPRRAERSKSSGSDESFPRVDEATQASRDGNRRSILERELASEEKLLAQGRQDALRNYAQQPGAQVSSDKVQLHERNIEALKKEIGKLK